MMAAAGNGQITVPPGFRFHPTEEELLYYYLRKKVSYQPIDLDVIRDVDLNKLEPWDLKDKCSVGSGPQTEWYFFSHKDKKYPTGTRTNRATMAGFWKATGRDKVIQLANAKRIGMRKTLVFYIGRAPNGQKTDWIMHEYRLNEDSSDQFQEDGWVVCRVFKKKTHQRELHPNSMVEQELQPSNHLRTNMISPSILQNNPNLHEIPWDFSFDNSMQLPQLLSAESSAFTTTPFNPTSSLNVSDIECSENLMKLMATNSVSTTGTLVQQERLNGDWSVLDKLLASHQNLDELIRGRSGLLPQLSSRDMNSTANGGLMQKFLVQYVGSDEGVMKFSK